MATRTGVIVGIDGAVGAVMADDIIRRLNDAFPGVKFVVIPYAHSVTFEFNDGQRRNEPPEPKHNPDPHR